MTEVPFRRRAGSLSGIWLALLVLALAAALPGAGAAQIPDTIRRGDTIQVPIPAEEVEADTLPRDSVPSATPDSLREAANLPRFGGHRPTGFAFGRWELSREDLLRYRVLSLGGILERIPGLSAFRGGGYGTPIGLGTYGFAGGRLRVFRDGYELDPLGTGAFDLQQIGLIDVESVRVERTPAEIRVHLESFRLPDERPYSEVEIGAGNYDTKLLRAILSRAFGTSGILVGSYDLATTDGYGIREPFQFGGGRLAGSYQLRPGLGVQAEFLASGVERGGGRFPLDASRRDAVVRARTAMRGGITFDLAVGQSSWTPNDSLPETLAGTTVTTDTLRPRLSSLQLLARAAYVNRLGSLEAGGRLRQGDERGFRTPDSEIFARGGLRPFPLLALDGEARVAAYDEGSGVETMATAAVGPFSGFTAFASAGTGERWLGTARDTTVLRADTLEEDRIVRREEIRTLYPAVASRASGFRAGVEWRRAGANAGLAFVALDPATVVPFGIGFDRGAAPAELAAVEGLEAAASLPLPYTGGAARLEASWSRWPGELTRPYLPQEQLRAGVELHRVLYDGQLEPTLRIEAEHRGRTRVPGAGGALGSAVLEPYSLANLYLQIRILDVRAFLLWENFLNNGEAFDLSGFRQPGQRIVYGGRWFFRD